MSQPNPADRLARLQRVLDIVLTRPQFSLAELKAELIDERPAFVTRLVRELTQQGHLQGGDDDTYLWVADPQGFPAKAWSERKVLGAQLPQSPTEDRPRERLLAHGAAALRTAELLAILIRAGRTGESALQAGEKLAARYGDHLERLAEAGRGELKAISAAVGETAYCQILAGIELGRRVAESRQERQQVSRRIVDSDDARAFCQERFARLASDGVQEEFHVVCLDAKNQVLGTPHRISVGTLDRSLLHPREVFRPAIKDAAKSVLLVHNHPSGDPTPSDEDFISTTRLEEAGKTVGIQVLDHVIVARNGTASIREHRSRQGSGA